MKWLVLMALVGCAAEDALPPEADIHSDATYIEEVCWPQAPQGCTDEIWEWVCDGSVVQVPYEQCISPLGGGWQQIYFVAEDVPCMLELKIQDTWDNLAQNRGEC